MLEFMLAKLLFKKCIYMCSRRLWVFLDVLSDLFFIDTIKYKMHIIVMYVIFVTVFSMILL